MTDSQDRAFMQRALDEARQADFPFGAVICAGDELLGAGRNSGARRGDPTAHGEMVAIEAVLATHGAERLRGATLYTSGEPCPMCMGAILWCGIARVVYAASIPELARRMPQITLRCEEIAARAFAPIRVDGPLMEREALALFDGK